ncbi:MAG TPA: molybdate ABC transporter substrate-binding protein, partial [Solirubrobacteraceae bacterium]
MPKQILGMTGVAVLAATVAGLALAARPAADPLTVYAATSLTNVMPDIERGATYSFGGSNTLRLQLERGAPADLFLAAEPKEAQALYHEGRCERPVTFATNKLVLIVPRDDPAGLKSIYGLRKGGMKLSIGNAAVPIGDYTRRLLRRLRLSSVLQSNTVSQQSNVGQVLSQVAFGGADAGFVYTTDARTERGRVDSLYVPQWAQPPIRYQGCVVKRAGADTRGARGLLAALRSGRGRGV